MQHNWTTVEPRVAVHMQLELFDFNHKMLAEGLQGWFRLIV